MLASYALCRADFAALRRRSGLAGRSAAMLRRSGSMRLITFSCDGLTCAGCVGRPSGHNDAIDVCSIQFAIIAQLCGAPADAGITMVIALSSSNWRGRQSSTRRLASPSCAVVMCGSIMARIWELS